MRNLQELVDRHGNRRTWQVGHRGGGGGVKKNGRNGGMGNELAARDREEEHQTLKLQLFKKNGGLHLNHGQMSKSEGTKSHY